MRNILCALLAASAWAADGDQVVTWSPGCLAKIYVCGKAEVAEGRDVRPGPSWPIKALPDSPAETQMLTALPAVDFPPGPDVFAKMLPPPYLVTKSKVLTGGVNFYAVEFEGYFLSTSEGTYTFSAETDDPVEIYLEGNAVAKHDFSANPNYGKKSRRGDDWWHKDWMLDPGLKPETAVAQGSVRLAPNRYYHVVLLNRQQWYPATGERSNDQHMLARDFNRGAFFKAFVNTPDGKTAPLALALPQVR